MVNAPLQQLGALLVAALFGAAGTAACLVPPAVPDQASGAPPGPALPALPRVPHDYGPPASVSAQPAPAGSVAQQVISTAVSSDPELPPARALEAYQRATTVMERADPGCRLSWPLLAAVGSVESDHGRVGGSVLGPDGVAHPAILGPPLDGAGSTARIVDTDHGSVDGDPSVDRAVGPLQLIPSTWAIVAVDGDADGIRDPQDIDDASLAAALYLCGWRDDLATDAGQRAAVFRYNRSLTYVDRVLQTMRTYATASAIDIVSVLVETTIEPPAEEVITAAGAVPGADADPAWAVPVGASWGVPLTTGWLPGPTAAPPPAPDPTPTPVPSTAPTTAPTSTGAPTDVPTGSPEESPPEEPTAPPSTATSSPDATPGATTPATQPSGHPDPGPSTGSPTDPGPSPLPTATESPAADPPRPPDPDPPAAMTTAEAEALSSCLVVLGDTASGGELAACLASALGLPADDPRLAWLVTQVPGREPQ